MQLGDQLLAEAPEHIGVIRYNQIFFLLLGVLLQLARAALDHTFAAQGADGSAEEAAAVEQKAHFFDIFAVQPCLFLDRKRIAAADLRPAGEAGTDVVRAVFVALGKQILLIPERGARADHAHIPLENVPELRNFIQGGLAQELPHAGDVLLGILQKVRRHVVRRAHLHGAEFHEEKIGFSLSDALLSEKGRAGVVELDCQNDQAIEP